MCVCVREGERERERYFNDIVFFTTIVLNAKFNSRLGFLLILLIQESSPSQCYPLSPPKERPARTWTSSQRQSGSRCSPLTTKPLCKGWRVTVSIELRAKVKGQARWIVDLPTRNYKVKWWWRLHYHLRDLSAKNGDQYPQLRVKVKGHTMWRVNLLSDKYMNEV